jgi:urea transport system permease protein
MFSLVISPSYAASDGENNSQPVAIAIDDETQALFVKLTKAKLKKIVPILEELEATGSNALLPVFEVMLKGQLHYLKKDRTSLMSVKKEEGEKVFHNIFTGEKLEPMKKKLYKKIKVNNKVRSFLRAAIARIQLNAEDPELRLSAITSLLSKLDSSLIDAIKEVKAKESNEEVLEMMDVAIAIYTLEKSKIQAERLAAIETLGGRLENEIKILLTKIVEHDEDTVIVSAAQKSLSLIEDRIANYQFIDKLFFGLSLGSVLLLAAIGLAITFGVMGVINMAHGEMIMLGAYTTYVVQLLMPNAIDYSIWVAIPAAFLVSGFVGICIERGVIRHLHGRPLETLLATFGISLILQQLVRTVFSPLNRQVETPTWMSGSLDINPVLSLTMNRLYILAFALLVFGLLLLILNKTSLGLNVRAVAQNRSMAKAMGIRTDWVDAMTFGLGSGIAGMAGVALSQLTNVGPNLGQAYIIDSFMVVVFGGVGNLWGTLVAGFSLGIANKFLEPVTGAVLASILVLVFIILFIQKKPKGLFPQKGRAAE